VTETTVSLNELSGPAPAHHKDSIWRASGRVRLRTLVVLRWMAIVGQTVTVLFVQTFLGFDVWLFACLSIIAVSAWLNVFLMVARPSQVLVREWEAAAQLGFDVLQLSALLAVTGGTENPFMLLYIAPVAISAAMLRPSVTAGLAALAFFCIGVLAIWHAPLPWNPAGGFQLPPLYQAGLTAAVMIGLAFTSVYAWRVAAEEERLNVALAAVQAVLTREQRLAALGGLAAAAAHELGTPLATIHLVAKEMARGLNKDSPLLEDVHLLVSQSERCRQILRQLSRRQETPDALHEQLPVRALLDEAAAPHRGLGPKVTVTVAGWTDAAGPAVRRMPEVIQGLRNLIENAVGFADQQVEVIATLTGQNLSVTVADDGPGFQPAVLARLGEPYVSERGAGDRAGGMGLGFFIAKTLLERSGAHVQFGNRMAPEHGAVVRATWRLTQIEAPPVLGASDV
jgi:two-component system, sensor histidine kinase RegB